METKKYTFWQLLDKHSIEIPIIQRDYAQGRVEESRIRDKFLDAIHNQLTKDDNALPMNLDFVYGRIKDEKLIPLDGQQRLTTLFLLHWYLAVKDKKLGDKVMGNLQKFTYETRVSSREFCKALSKNQIDLSGIDDFAEKDRKLSKLIEDKNWFFKSWKKDPTIKSMLLMLDAIHEKFTEKDLFNKLICENNPPITFDFLPLDYFNLTDELYIKMNARGKPLTVFENFKANFEKYLDSLHHKSKLDNTWTDLFWKYKDKNNVIDNHFFSFFTNIILSFYAENNEIEKGKKIDDISLFDIYETVCAIKDNVERIIKLLDVLSYRIPEEIKSLFEIFIEFRKENSESESKLSYWDRIRFYAIALFLINNGEITDQNRAQFLKWKRVTFNLINNTLIQSPEDFSKAIKSLKNLSEKMNEIYDYLSSEACKIEFYLQTQVDEERTKAKLLENNEWEKEILNIEKHWYFDGQIGFILELAKENGQYNQKKFYSYSEKLERLFQENILNREDFVLQRALLAQGDYSVQIGRNYSFCSSEIALRTKNDNWRKVFNDFEKRKFLKKLLDSIDITTFMENLQDITLNSKIDDWRKYFIKNPKILKYCRHLQTRFYSIKELQDEYEILLLEKTQTNGYHAEYYTYALFLDLESRNVKNIEYIYQKSEVLSKEIKIGNKNIVWNSKKKQFNYNNNFYDFDNLVIYIEENNVL